MENWNTLEKWKSQKRESANVKREIPLYKSGQRESDQSVGAKLGMRICDVVQANSEPVTNPVTGETEMMPIGYRRHPELNTIERINKNPNAPHPLSEQFKQAGIEL